LHIVSIPFKITIQQTHTGVVCGFVFFSNFVQGWGECK